MKQKILFAAMLLCSLIPMSMNAQLKVANTGKVGIAIPNFVEPLSSLTLGAVGRADTKLFINGVNSSANTQYGLYSNISTSIRDSLECAIYGYSYGQANMQIGVKGEAKSYYTTGYPFIENVFGVLGTASGSRYGGNYGVYGVIKTVNKGAGVVGSNDGIQLIMNERYGGYFYGKTKVNGDFYATTVTTTSDARLKTGIADVRADILHQFGQLRPVQFKWQQTQIASADKADTTKHNFFSNDIDFDKLHYGLLAQEVKNVFPSLVHEDAEGYLSVNYIELIPLLIQAINTQQQQIADLQAQIANSEDENVRQLRIASKQSETSFTEQAVLYQNNPNPFSVETQIKYLLPQSTENATLYVYNMNGLQLAEYPISSFGEGSVVVSAGSLQAGIYLYSLIADGQVIDTKRMILTK